MRNLIIILAVTLIAVPAVAQEGDEIRDGHREAARRFFESFEEGLRLSGTLTHNDSEGSFDAYFYGDEWLVQQHFGKLDTVSYSKLDDMWSGSNYSLPFKLEPEDNPASITMNLISNGQYLEEPYWDYFTYEGEDAGGFNFLFRPPDMPQVELVLYSDPEEEQYLQIMSSEIALAENDPTSINHRSYYYYQFDDEGRILTSRETGREIDNEGETVNFMDFVVDEHELLGQRPAALQFDTTRHPVGDASATLDGPVAIPVDIDKGYFLVPMNFADSDETFLFLFDTGATAALFSPAAAEASGLTADLEVTGHGHGSRSKFQLGLCTTASMGEAGSEAQAPLAGFPATRISEENTEVLDALAWYGAAGILGVSPLHQYVISFDHAQRQIVCFPPDGFDAGAQLSTPNLELWLDVEDLIYAKGRLVDQVEGEVIIDTGLQQDLAILGETAAANGLELEKIDERNSTVLGGVRSFDYVKVPSFELGPLRMENKVASLTDDDRGSLSARGLLGFVGITMFFGVRITLDLFDQRMYIEDPLGTGLFEGLVPGQPEDGGEPESAPEDEGDLEVIISGLASPAPDA
jgi:hypothetical protein